MEIHSVIKNIPEIFYKGSLYEITRFQREYAWEKEEVSELLNDIFDSIIFNKENSEYENSDYFIGSLVMVKAENDVYQVIDGQQRLTTISIILSILIEKLKEFDSNAADKNYYKYIVYKDEKDNMRFKLKNENIQDILYVSILAWNKSDSVAHTLEEKRLKQNYEYIEKKIESYITDNPQLKINSLINQIDKLKTIFITVDDESEAYSIFEILNSKGQELDSIDLIKNLLFKYCDSSFPIDSAKKTWTEIKSNLLLRDKPLSIDEYFRTYWLSKNGYTPKAKLYQSVKKVVNNEEKSRILLTGLHNKVNLFQKINNPQTLDWRNNKVIFNCLNSLKQFNVKSAQPFIFSLLSKYELSPNILKIREVKYILDVIEKFHFLFTAISSQRASGLDRLYAKYANLITNSNSVRESREILREMKNKLLDKVPSFDTFEENFKKLYFTNEITKDKKLITYIFKKIEENSRRTSELSVYEISLEHIIPQSRDHKYVGSIGNILPLDIKLNNRMGNREYTQKIITLQSSELKVVEEFVSEFGTLEEWTEELVLSRTNSLAQMAYNVIWKFN